MTRGPAHPAPMPKTNFNLGIQLLRGIAALLVVFHHSLEESRALSPHIAPKWLILSGACGVDIFFVISGFIIYNVTYGRSKTKPEPPPVFLLKRFLRIFPMYWICLAATLALWSSGYFYKSMVMDFPRFLSALFLLPFGAPVIDVAWTLVFEMYFYYIFAITLAWRNATLSVFGTTAVIVAVVLASRFLPEGSLKQMLSNPIALEFAFGVILSHFISRPSLRARWLRYAWIPGVTLFAVASAVTPSDGTAGLQPAFRFFAWGVPALLVTASFIAIPFEKTFLTRLFLPVGNASYSLYLTHPFFMISFAFLLKGHLGRVPALAFPLVIVVVGASLAFGLFAHYWIERPVLARLRDRFELPPPMP
jgi:exopolysaccharide production protein ExoZ